MFRITFLSFHLSRLFSKLTSSYVDVPRNDRSELVLGHARVDLGVHVLAVVFGAERRKHQISIGENLAQSGHFADGRSIAADPDHFRRGISGGTAFDDGAG